MGKNCERKRGFGEEMGGAGSVCVCGGGVIGGSSTGDAIRGETWVQRESEMGESDMKRSDSGLRGEG